MGEWAIAFGGVGLEAGVLAGIWGMRAVIARWAPAFSQKAFAGWTLRGYLAAGGLSLALSLAMFADSALIVRALGVMAPLSLVLLGNSLSLLSGLLPIEAPLGVGTIEAGWALPLVSAGVSASASLAIAVDYHAVTLAYCAMLGLPALFALL